MHHVWRRQPDLAGFSRGAAGEVYACGGTQIAFDTAGAISRLEDETSSWADENHTLLQLKYRAYSAADVTEFFREYQTPHMVHCHAVHLPRGALLIWRTVCVTGEYVKAQSAWWVPHDYGKPGLPSSVGGQVWSARLHALYVRRSDDACSFALRTSFPPEASEKYGAAAGWTMVEVRAGGEVEVEVGMFNKSATRLPEAMSVHRPHTPCTAHTVHLRLGAPLIWCTMGGIEPRYHMSSLPWLPNMAGSSSSSHGTRAAAGPPTSWAPGSRRPRS